jgi:2-dehydro-3-deoxy-D-gluconate 5-dehydrogenase
VSVLDRFSLAGKRALVTGASRGLGAAIALALAEAGADVVCASSAPSGADATVSAIRALKRESWSVAGDLASPAGRDAVIADTQRAIGGIDILVNNGGTIARYPAAEYPMAEWNRVLATNLDAVFFLSQWYGQRMIERGAGKIINIASLLSFSGGMNVAAYTASKHAIGGVTKALANEWAKHNVQVNAIAPGYFVTDNTRPLRDDATRFADVSARIPAGRWGKPDDLAGAVVFLASGASDYMNGHVLVVDGGWMAR